MPLFFLLILVGVIVAVYAHRNRKTRRCRWRQSRAGSKGALIKYNCVICGAEAFSSNGTPDSCLSAVGHPKL
jgi:hypothetical protein